MLRENDGRYAVGFDKLCRCGHPKGCHLAGENGRTLGACISHEVPAEQGGTMVSGEFGPDCGCEQFRGAR